VTSSYSSNREVILRQRIKGGGQGGWLVRWDAPADLVVHRSAQAANVAGDHGPSVAQRFGEHQGEPTLESQGRNHNRASGPQHVSDPVRGQRPVHDDGLIASR
jgi:hypothetical protein